MLLILSLIPFVQLGLSYYVSVAAVNTSLLLSSSGRNFKRLFGNHALMRIGASLCFLISTLAYPLADSEDYLRSVRTGFFFFLIGGVSYWSLSRLSVAKLSRIVCGIYIIAGGLVVLVVAQYIFLGRGTYFGIPREFFVQNGGMIPSALDLRYSQIRPSGTFGEPSYLGGVCLSLTFALSPIISFNRKARNAVICLGAATVISATMMGILSCLVYLWYSQRKQLSYRARVFFSICAFLVVFALIIFSENKISSRMQTIMLGEDFSTLSRLVIPLSVVPSIWEQYPLGIPFGKFIEMGTLPFLNTTAEELSHNSILNLLINCGVLGIGICLVLFKSLRFREIQLFALLLSMQSGSFFSIDKFALFATGVVIFNTLRLTKAVLTPTELAAI